MPDDHRHAAVMEEADRIASWARKVLATQLPVGLSSRLAAPGAPLERDWDPFRALVRSNHLAAMLLDAADRGHFPLTDRQRADAVELERMSSVRVMWLESVLLNVVETFERLEIPVRVLKGAALARTVYGDRDRRRYSDVDLLVPRSRFDEAVLALTAGGAKRAHEEPRRGFVARFGKSAELIRQDGASIDLHVSLAAGPHAVLIRNADLFETSTPFEVAGRQLLGLGVAERFVHACFHATTGNPAGKLMPLLDVVRTLEAPGVDEDAVHRLAERWRAEGVVARALQKVWSELNIEQTRPLLQWARSQIASASEERLLIPRSDAAWQPAHTRAVMAALPTLRAKAAYAGALVLPSAAYRAERGQTATGRVAAFVRRVRRSTRNGP